MNKFLPGSLLVLILAALLTLTPGRAAAQFLFVANYGSSTVSEYNAATGTSVNPTFVPSVNGFYYPTRLSVLNNTLYVASTQSVTAYDATTGAPATGFSAIPPRGGYAYGVLASGALLYVTAGTNSLGNGTVSAHNALTGLADTVFASPLRPSTHQWAWRSWARPFTSLIEALAVPSAPTTP